MMEKNCFVPTALFNKLKYYDSHFFLYLSLLFVPLSFADDHNI